MPREHQRSPRGPVFNFDQDQLARNVIRRKAERGLTFQDLAQETRVSYPRLMDYFVSRPRVPRTRKRSMSADVVLRLLMWLGDYDIRDYLLEEK
jgi:hypothetical protein